MSKYLLLGCILLIGIASLGVNATITFPHDTEQCLGQLVEYQCTMTGTGFLSLTWRILDDNGIENDSIAYTSTANGVNTIIGEGIFTVEQLQQSPLISNISFTVQSSINGYTIVCEDSIISMNNENLTINIAGPPQPPTDITDLSCTANTTVEVTWTPPSYSSQCITGYTIINTTTNNSIINTTDTSTSIVLTGLSVGIYCISIASIDTANRIGTYSQQECIELTVPSEPLLQYEAFIGLLSDNVIIRLSWIFNSSFNPPLTATYLNISTESSYTITMLPASTTEYDITIMRGIDYIASIFGENILGNGISNSIAIYTTPGTCTSGSITSLAVTIPLTLLITAIISIIMSSIVTLLISRRYYNKQDNTKQQQQQQQQQALYDEPIIMTTTTTTNVHTTNNPAYGQIRM